MSYTKAIAANPYNNGGVNPDNDPLQLAVSQQIFKFTADLPPNSASIQLSATKSAWAAGTVTAGAAATTTVTVTGAKVGDLLRVLADTLVPNGVAIVGYVSADDTVTLKAVNSGSGSAVVGTINVAVSVWPAAMVTRLQTLES